MIPHQVVVESEPVVVPLVDVFGQSRRKLTSLPVVLAPDLEPKLVEQKHLHHAGMLHHLLGLWTELRKAFWAHF